MKPLLKFVILVLAAAGLAFGAFRLVKLRKKQLQSIRIAPARAVPVVPGEIRKGTFLLLRPYTGVLASNRQAQVKARVQGQVTGISKREGDPVHAGEPLVQLDGTPGKPRGSRLAVQEALRHQEKALSDNRRTRANLLSILRRTMELYRKKMASLDQVQLLENQVEAASVRISDLERALASSRERLGFFTVRALFDGRIARVLVNEGDVVMPGLPLVEIESPSPCKVEVQVSTEDLASLRPGLEARIRLGGRSLSSRLARVHPSARGTGVGIVEIDLPRPPFGLPLGASLTVEIPVNRIENTLLAPADSVLQGPVKSTVFKIEDGKIRPVPVRVLGASSTGFAVEGQLKEGDRVATGSDSLLLRLAAGTRVVKTEPAHE